MRGGRTLMGRLLRARLRWYAACTGRLLIRHWQWFVLALALLPMGLSLPQVMAVIGSPFLVLLDPGVSFPSRFGLMMALSALAALWVYPQRRQVLGTDFEPYLRSLPIDPLPRTVADVVTSFAAISLVIVPAFAAMLTSNEIAQSDLVRRSISLLAVVWALLLGSFTVLRPHPARLVLLGGANLVLAAGLGVTDLALRLPVLALAVTVTSTGFLLLARPGTSAPTADNQWRDDAASERTWRRHGRICFILPWKVLGENRVSTALRLAAAGVASGFALAIPRAFDFDSRAWNVGVSVVAINALLLCGVCRLFRNAREASGAYLAALPLRDRHWLVPEIVCLCTLGALFTIPLAAGLVVQGVVTVPLAAFVAVAQLPLLAALHRIVARAGRHGVLVGALSTVGWIWAILSVT